MKKILPFALFILQCHFSLAQWTTNVNDIYNSNTGNVGIGTTTPSSKLHIYTSGATKVQICSNATQLASLELNNTGLIGAMESLINGGSGNLVGVRIGSKNNYRFSLFTNDIDRVSILADGKVGIGKTTPVYPLDVNGIINATGIYINGVAQWTNTGSNIKYGGTGNVGIGASNPDFKLTVNGKIKCEELQVVVDVPADYVFEEKYRLMPLDEVEKFINENKHLPGIPRAREITKDGWNVGEMSNVLLEKIEELTLYMIELKKENEELKKKVEKLEK